MIDGWIEMVKSEKEGGNESRLTTYKSLEHGIISTPQCRTWCLWSTGRGWMACAADDVPSLGVDDD